MTPKQYEDYIGALYTQKGYKVTVSPLSNDLGIDVIATKDNEKIGIQASMSFDEAWEKYIFPLKDKILHNSHGPNHIIEANWTGIERVTSKGRKGKIDIEGFRLAYNVLMKQGHITRNYINQQVDKRCSSGIVLILEQLPFVEKTQSPTGLRLKKHS